MNGGLVATGIVLMIVGLLTLILLIGFLLLPLGFILLIVGLLVGDKKTESPVIVQVQQSQPQYYQPPPYAPAQQYYQPPPYAGSQQAPQPAGPRSTGQSIFCANCGAPRDAGNFCKSCGAKLG